MSRRPLPVLVVSAGLVLVGVLAAAAGLVASWISSCCGSRDPGTTTPLWIGLGLATALIWAGAGLLSARMTRRRLLLLTALAPLVCLGAAPSSSDLAALVLPAALAWAWLAFLLTRPTFTAWLAAPGRGASVAA